MRLLSGAAIALPGSVLADGGLDDPPPQPATACTGSQAYDHTKGKCVDPQNSALDREDRYEAVRQLAYAGRYADAQAVLDTMEADDPGRLTHMGFTHRKLGNRDRAMAYYTRALAIEPASILVRSYMGQGHVEDGRIDLALVQLRQIKVHGGTGSWSEKSLRNAIATGTTYSY